MFTGIIQSVGTIDHIAKHPDHWTFSISAEEGVWDELVLGASVAVDGVCLSAVSVRDEAVTFDVMQETLEQTTLGVVREGIGVNIERSARLEDEIGGHIVSGHVYAVGEVIERVDSEETARLTVRVDEETMPYIFDKGFVAVNGASITVYAVDRIAGTFTVALIPDTLKRTTFSKVREGDSVNIEIDRTVQAVVDTAERMFKEMNS